MKEIRNRRREKGNVACVRSRHRPVCPHHTRTHTTHTNYTRQVSYVPFGPPVDSSARVSPGSGVLVFQASWDDARVRVEENSYHKTPHDGFGPESEYR